MASTSRDAVAVLRLTPIRSPAGSDRFPALVAFVAGGKGARLAAALDEAELLEPDALASSPLEEVVDALREVRIEADPKLVRLLQRLAAWHRDHRDVLEFEPGPGEDRPPFPHDDLRAVNGVGRATADGIALRIFGEPVYPVDRASYRIMVRHGWIDPTADYDEAAQVLIAATDRDAGVLIALADAFETIGRRHCKVAAPRCERCPLRVVLPEGGPIEVDG